MFLLNKNGITVALWELQALKKRMKRNDCYIEHFECHPRDNLVQKIKEVRFPKKIVLDDEKKNFFSIGSMYNLIRAVFFQNLNVYLRKTCTIVLFKVLPI